MLKSISIDKDEFGFSLTFAFRDNWHISMPFRNDMKYTDVLKFIHALHTEIAIHYNKSRLSKRKQDDV